MRFGGTAPESTHGRPWQAGGTQEESIDIEDPGGLFDSLAKGFCVIEVIFEDGYPVDHRFLEVNDAFEELTGLDDVVGERMRELEPEHEEYWFQIFGRVAETGESVSFEHEAIPLIDGWYEVNAVRIGGDESRRVAVLFDDVTDRRRAREELARSNERKDEFLALLAHELRNPLAPIRNAVELLTEESADPELVERAVPMLERQVAHMQRLLDDLLDINRVNQGTIELELECFDLGEIVGEVVEAYRPRVEEESRDFSLRLPDEPIVLEADPERLRQILGNLLDNACKFTDEGDPIRLSIERAADDAIIRVSDGGIGIPEDQLPSLFEQFAKVEAPTGDAEQGLGLGLSLVEELVELHGGTIEADSDGPGDGAEFTVRLPAIEDADPARSGEFEPVSPRSCRILVVDDNRDAADSLATILEMEEHEVELAYDGGEALQRADPPELDVVILDLGLPELDGLEVCRQLRSEPGGDELLILAATGWGERDDYRKTQEAGFDTHLVKPVDPDEILARIASHVEE